MMEIPQLFDVVGKSQATATPAWVGGGGRPGPPRRRGTQPRQRRVTDTQFREFPTIPSFYDAAETPDFDPSAAGTHLPGPVGFAESPPRPDWRRTCARWRGIARSCQSCTSVPLTSRLRPCTKDDRCRRPPALRSQCSRLRTQGPRPNGSEPPHKRFESRHALNNTKRGLAMLSVVRADCTIRETAPARRGVASRRTRNCGPNRRS